MTDEFEYEVTLGSTRNGDAPPAADPFSRDAEVYKGLGDNLRKKKSRLKKAADDNARSKANHEKPTVFSGYDLLDVAYPKYNLKQLGELFPKDDTHFAAIRAKVSNVVGIGFDLGDSHATRKKKDKAAEDPERIKSIDIKLQNEKFKMLSMLDDLNKDDDFIDILEKFYTDYEAVGNGYIEVGRTARGVIGYVGHIPAHTVRVRNGRDGFVQIVGEKPVFFRNFGDTTTTDPIGSDARPNEIIHMKKYNPVDLYYGMPDIIPALNAVAGNNFSDEFNLDYFENKAVPRHMILVRGAKMARDSREKIVKFFDEDLRGKHHRTLLLTLPPDQQDRKNDIEVKPVEAGAQEASFSLYSKRNTERILMVHRVPPTLVGMTENVPHAVGRMADKSFKELTVRPTQKKIEKRVNKIIAEFTDLFKFKLHELTLTDELSQASIDETYYNLNALTPNEVRGRNGWPSLPDGHLTAAEIAEKSDKAASEAQTQRREQGYQDNNSRRRDQQRNANRTDSVGEERNPQGEGRRQS